MTVPFLRPGTETGADLDTAVHEAAHAVAMVATGVPFTDVTVGAIHDPEHGTLRGQVRGDPARAFAHRLRYAVVAVAGVLAEHRVTGVPLEDLADTCGQVDMALADDLVQGIAPHAALSIWRRADRLISAHSAAIATTAHALICRGTLTEQEVRAIVTEWEAKIDDRAA